MAYIQEKKQSDSRNHPRENKALELLDKDLNQLFKNIP